MSRGDFSLNIELYTNVSLKFLLARGLSKPHLNYIPSSLSCSPEGLLILPNSYLHLDSCYAVQNIAFVSQPFVCLSECGE
jgi:hypothetical protein